MRDAIFLTIARYPELETWIAHFSGAADSATVERFFVASRMSVESLSPDGDLFPLPKVPNDSRSKENEVIAQCHNE